MHGEDKESQKRGTERGGEGELTGGHPSKLLSTFSPPVETPGEVQGNCQENFDITIKQFFYTKKSALCIFFVSLCLFS